MPELPMFRMMSHRSPEENAVILVWTIISLAAVSGVFLALQFG
jgi:hypothetical protein